MSGSSSGVERLLAKQKVVGSNPIFRSIEIGHPQESGILAGDCGDVAKWLRRRSAKPLFGGSNPPVAFIELSVYGKSGIEEAPILS